MTIPLIDIPFGSSDLYQQPTSMRLGMTQQSGLPFQTFQIPRRVSVSGRMKFSVMTRLTDNAYGLLGRSYSRAAPWSVPLSDSTRRKGYNVHRESRDAAPATRRIGS
jgi:hypothetical protein